MYFSPSPFSFKSLFHTHLQLSFRHMHTPLNTQSAVSKKINKKSPCIRGKSSTHLELGEQEIVIKHTKHSRITTLEHM